jgi:hypothetical protein
LYFLGNKRRYPFAFAEEFTEQAPGCFGENKDRPLLLNPVLEGLEDFRGQVLALCSKPPIDLEDWLGASLIEQVLFVTLTEEEFPYEEELNLTHAQRDTSSILRQLENPLKKLWIAGQKGADFVPLAWDIRRGGEAKAFWENGKFQLMLSPQGEILELHLKALADAAPWLYLQRERGQVEEIRAEREQPWFSEARWREVEESALPAVKAGLEKASFWQ